DFVRNMLAGVGAVDAVLLVVALDEGVMPQTREHLAILRILGVERGIVALTKRDLVDDEWAALARADVTAILRETPLAAAPAVAAPGRRVALNLTGIEREDLARGMAVARPGTLAPTSVIAGRVALLDTAADVLAHDDDVKLHTGTAEVMARVSLLEGNELVPG